jgi:hypothetical protein
MFCPTDILVVLFWHYFIYSSLLTWIQGLSALNLQAVTKNIRHITAGVRQKM